MTLDAELIVSAALLTALVAYAILVATGVWQWDEERYR